MVGSLLLINRDGAMGAAADRPLVLLRKGSKEEDVVDAVSDRVDTLVSFLELRNFSVAGGACNLRGAAILDVVDAESALTGPLYSIPSKSASSALRRRKTAQTQGGTPGSVARTSRAFFFELLSHL